MKRSDLILDGFPAEKDLTQIVITEEFMRNREERFQKEIVPLFKQYDEARREAWIKAKSYVLD